MDAAGNVTKGLAKDVEDDEPEVQPLDEDDIEIMRLYGLGAFTVPIKNAEIGVKDYIRRINKLIGIRESDTGELCLDFCLMLKLPHWGWLVLADQSMFDSIKDLIFMSRMFRNHPLVHTPHPKSLIHRSTNLFMFHRPRPALAVGPGGRPGDDEARDAFAGG